jgi:iron complex outermembrane receptor protein
VPVGTGDPNFVVSDYYNSGFAWDPDNRLRRPSYDVLNASVDWSAPNNAWAVRLWGSNLTGQRYCVVRDCDDAARFVCSRVTANLRDHAPF